MAMGQPGQQRPWPLMAAESISVPAWAQVVPAETAMSNDPMQPAHQEEGRGKSGLGT